MAWQGNPRHPTVVLVTLGVVCFTVGYIIGRLVFG